MKKQAEGWLHAARDDLLVISEIIGNDNLTHMVAFHAQQAIEKSLKAILEEKDISVPRTHNIIVLREMTDPIIHLDIDTAIFDQINELYLDSRYPTDIGLLPEGKPPIETARLFYDVARKIVDSISTFPC